MAKNNDIVWDDDVVWDKQESPNKQFLPGYEKTEQRIASRDPRESMDAFLQTAGKHPIRSAMAAAMPGSMSPLMLQGMGMIHPRVEAAVANPALAIQAGQPGKILPGIAQGIGGQRMGQLGDVMRNVMSEKIPGWASEVLSGTTGIAGMMGVYKAMSGLKEVGKKLPRLMTDKWRVQQASQTKRAVDETITGMRKQYDKIYTPVQDTPVKVNKVKDVFDKLPKSIKKEIPKEIQELDTVGKVKQARDFITKQINEGSFIKAQQAKGVNINQGHLMEVSKRLKQVILDSVDDTTKKAIEILDPQYQEVVKKGFKISKTVWDYQSNSYKTSGIINVYKNSNQSGARQMFTDFSKYSKDLKQVIKNMGKFSSRQSAKSTARYLAPYAALTAGLGFGGYYAGKGLGKMIPGGEN
ncbi:MAG: hypothetical protein KJ718_01195 [Nanoarchaeota archaeon]|nr:hypothetical protein [Nanoarchaeota archaeon]